MKTSQLAPFIHRDWSSAQAPGRVRVTVTVTARASPGRRKPDSRPIGRPLIRKLGPFGPRGILSTQRH